MILKEGLEELGEFIVSELAIEFAAQGHKNTGKMIEGLEYRLVEDIEGYILEITTDKNYTKYVNSGVPANRIKVGTKMIEGLMRWIEQKGLERGKKKVKNMAWAIAMKMKKEGMPTKNSLQYSTTGTRTGAIDTVFDRIQNEVLDIIVRINGEELEYQVDQIIRKAA